MVSPPSVSQHRNHFLVVNDEALVQNCTSIRWTVFCTVNNVCKLGGHEVEVIITTKRNLMTRTFNRLLKLSALIIGISLEGRLLTLLKREPVGGIPEEQGPLVISAEILNMSVVTGKDDIDAETVAFLLPGSWDSQELTSVGFLDHTRRPGSKSGTSREMYP